jgi:hypothetical protein
MPILFIGSFLLSCGLQKGKERDETSRIIRLNQTVVQHQESVVSHFQSLYHGLYIQPIEVLVDKYYQLDSVIHRGLDSILILGPASPDSLIYKPSLRLFNYYDSASSTLIWTMVLIMERFELEGFDDTYRIGPLADSLSIREEELLLQLKSAQQAASSKYNLEMEE